MITDTPGWAPESGALIDIGVNLTNKSFARDLDAVLERAAAANVGRMIVTGTDLASSAAALSLALAQPGRLYATAGVHPHHASDWMDASGPALVQLAAKPAVVAIGECGLDFNRDFSPRPAQEKAFMAQLELAATVQLPVFLHQRDAHDAFMRILSSRRASLVGGVAHCFTGTADELAAYLDLDLHIGITGWICDERRGTHLQELVARIPADRLLLETDAPYLLPRDLRPRPKDRRNEPAFLAHVCAAVAEWRGESADAVARASTRNAEQLFNLNGIDIGPL